jgi:hypothetical protein
MSLKIPQPAIRWDQQYQIRVNQAIEQADVLNRKVGATIELGQTERIIIRSPNGSRYYLTVSNAGVVGATFIS